MAKHRKPRQDRMKAYLTRLGVKENPKKAVASYLAVLRRNQPELYRYGRVHHMIGRYSGPMSAERKAALVARLGHYAHGAGAGVARRAHAEASVDAFVANMHKRRAPARKKAGRRRGRR